ncbi:hypothetical protein BpHYR1_020030, partial [Brachionus plicatilis]
DKGLPGLDVTVKSKLLKARLVSSVPETTKTFLELIADKKWSELIEIFENQVDYKSVLPGQFKQEIEINKAVPKPQYETRRFVGNCNYCNKPGHKWALCRRRMFDADKKGESKDTWYERKHQQQTPNYQMQSQNYQHRMHQNQNQSVYNNKQNYNQNRPKTSAFTFEAEVEDESEVVANTVQCES